MQNSATQQIQNLEKKLQESNERIALLDKEIATLKKQNQDYKESYEKLYYSSSLPSSWYGPQYYSRGGESELDEW
jgi:TolA-binding protein